MGKRSRKRITDDDVAGGTSRAERDAARLQRAEAAKAQGKGRAAAGTGRAGTRRERPAAPWGKFPLTELVMVLAIVMFVLAFAVFGIETPRGNVSFLCGIVLGMLAGVETAIRDHFSGYRSHSTLLAGIITVMGMAALTALLRWVAPGTPTWLALTGTFLAGSIVFAAVFPAFRRAFAKRSGGKAYR